LHFYDILKQEPAVHTGFTKNHKKNKIVFDLFINCVKYFMFRCVIFLLNDFVICCLQNVTMELSESTASGHVTVEWLVKCVINQLENVRLVADRVLLATAARYVSSLILLVLSMHQIVLSV